MERKENRLPIFTERFRELQGERSNTEFAEFLDLSRQTVGFYCNGDRLPDIMTLLQIAKKCGVSTDYLLGQTDVKTNDMSTRAICEYTGLTSNTISLLHGMIDMGPLIFDFVSRFFEDIVVWKLNSIDAICSNIVKASRANAIYTKMKNEGHLPRDVALDIENFIDSFEGRIDGYYKIGALDAAAYFMGNAKEIASNSMNEIIEEMVSELSSENIESGVVNLPNAKIWKTFDEDE